MKLLDILGPFWESAKGIVPLSGILIFIQLVILRKPIANAVTFTLGIVLASVGLHLFLYGTSISLIPLGDSVGRNLVVIDNKWLIILIGFVIGYLGTLVEPALKILALEVEELSQGAILNTVLIHGVAAGFGGGMAIGLYKIMSNVPFVKVIIPLLLIIVILSFITPEPFGAIAMDAASATTGPVNIPLNMAVAIGLASIIEGVDPLLSGFGIIGLTSIGSMISVMVLGILTKL
ncbi:MAG: DUF1538 domain-containing protein [Gudongella sp.]|jgi:hypothetical protein|nr:DUF1538 domain-containing protein [Gudongella sp.]